jgi:adenylylsulfate kinase
MSRDARGTGFTLWFTGLPSAGKSTLASAIADLLRARGARVEVLDGDEIRESLSKDLGYSKADRDTQIRRIGHIARLLSRNDVVTIVAAVSPFGDARADVRRAHEAPFIEIFVSCSIEEAIRRDCKGLYARALRNEIKDFTGVSQPYEAPANAEIVVCTERETVDESVAKIVEWLRTEDLWERS